MKKNIVNISFLFLIIVFFFTAFAAIAGQVVNPYTGKIDKCVTIQTIDGTVKDTTCKDVKVTNGALADNGDGTYTLTTGVGGGGDVTGPASAVDNEITRFDGTTGKIIQSYTSGGPTVGDTGTITVNVAGTDLTSGTNQHIAIMPNGTGNVGIGTSTPATKLEVSGTVTATAFAGPLTGAVTGNASTATALGANGTNCSSGNYPLGVDASGVAESCTADDDTPDSDSEVPNNVTLATTTQVTISAVGNDVTTGTNEHLALMPNGTGNVGVGTSTPSTKLAVSGTVTATAFAGPLTGNVTGNASGSAATITGDLDPDQLSGDSVDDNLVATSILDTDGAGDCATGKVCLGDHTHAATYQPLEATLTDIADGTIAGEDLVNTAFPWADNEVVDTITASNYLLLSGAGAMTGQLVTDNLGIEFEDSDTNPTCAAGNYSIYADLSETKLKKCQNGTASDLSAGGYTNLTSFIDQTAWQLFYANGSGDVTELALGASGTYLKSNGAAAAPTWVTPAGTGDVVGPASATDNAITRFDGTTGKLVQNSAATVADSGQIAIPTDYALKIGANSYIYDINGETWIVSNATWDGSNFNLVNTGQNAILLQLMGANKGFPVGGAVIEGTRSTEGTDSDGMAAWKIPADSTNPIDNQFAGDGNDLRLMWGSLYGNFAIEGMGLEIDGNATPPFGRVVHNNKLSSELTALVTNVFADFSGVDDENEPSLFAGFFDASGADNDFYRIMRADEAITGAGQDTYTNWTHFLDIDSNGNVGIGKSAPVYKLDVVGTSAFSDQILASNKGIEFTESDTNPTCAAGNFNIFADLSENKLKKCTNGSATDLDTTAGTPSFDGISGGTNTTAAMVVGTGGSLTVSGSGSITASAIVDDAVVEADFKAVDAASDEECLTYETTTGDFEWQACGSGGGDSITVNTTAATDANFLNGDIDFSINTGASPDDITATVGCTDCVALTTETSGNYVANVANGLGLTGGSAGSEGAALTLGFDTTAALTGDHATTANQVKFGVSGLIFEGATDNTIETYLAVPDPVTTDKTITFPNATDTLVGKATTDTLTNKTLAAADNVIEADTGDSATSFFSTGTIEDGRLPSSMADKVITGSLAIPQGTAPTVDAAGEIAQDTTADQLLYGATPRVLTYFEEKCVTLETPVAADDNVPFFHPKQAITITDVTCEVDGGTSIELIISDGTNALETITCDGDGAMDDGSIANGTFTADERMEFDLGTVSGTNTWLNFCITYTIDRQ